MNGGIEEQTDGQVRKWTTGFSDVRETGSLALIERHTVKSAHPTGTWLALKSVSWPILFVLISKHGCHPLNFSTHYGPNFG